MNRRVLSVIVCVMAVTNIASADIVQGINLDFVTIGNAGNPGDTRAEAYPSGCGAVDYNYRIGKYEITNAQWDAFVDAAGAPTGNPSSAYNQSASYTGAQQPTNYVSCYEAAQFCNWLTSGDKSLGAYQLGTDGSITVDRPSAVSAYGVIYVLPTEDEWYKAAYYKPDGSGYSTYANGEESIPPADDGWNYYGGAYSSPWDVGTGTMEQNGTFDIMGNVWEWNETLKAISSRGFRGGSYAIEYYYANRPGFPETVSLSSSDIAAGLYPDRENSYLGFRIASVPEPAEPNILVSPLTHDFGNVELGTSRTVILTISNTGTGDLTVNGIALETDFAITLVPAAAILVEPSETKDVEITYTPTALGYNSAVLKITSDDPDEPIVEVALGAVGI